MPYVTGQADSLASLITALQNACTANGWTLGGNVLSRNGCHAEVMLATNGETGAPPNGTVRVRVGNGVDGSNLLTDAASGNGSIGPLRDPYPAESYTDWDWPVTYHIHVLTNPDEVYLFVSYGAGQFWQNLGFGQSPAIGNAGTGNWFHGTLARIGRADLYRRVDAFNVGPAGSYLFSFEDQYISGAPFFWYASKDDSLLLHLSSQIHGCIADSAGGGPIWSHEVTPMGDEDASVVDGAVSAITGQTPLLAYQPNAWNDEAALVRCQIMQTRPENKTSVIGELQHLRWTRNDYLSPGTIVTLGADRWKVYPVYRRDTVVRDGSNSLNAPIDHSGTIAMAIRYDGP